MHLDRGVVELEGGGAKHQRTLRSAPHDASERGNRQPVELLGVEAVVRGNASQDVCQVVESLQSANAVEVELVEDWSTTLGSAHLRRQSFVPGRNYSRS